MRVALLIAGLALIPAGPAHADIAAPPYIDHTEWVRWGGVTSLRVYPTPAGREASTEFVSAEQAWSEVLADAPDADSPGMRAQFVCHWQLAEFAAPGKTSWNVEPWRPQVSPTEMIASGCNPGGAEESW